MSTSISSTALTEAQKRIEILQKQNEEAQKKIQSLQKENETLKTYYKHKKNQYQQEISVLKSQTGPMSPSASEILSPRSSVASVMRSNSQTELLLQEQINSLNEQLKERQTYIQRLQVQIIEAKQKTESLEMPSTESLEQKIAAQDIEKTALQEELNKREMILKQLRDELEKMKHEHQDQHTSQMLEQANEIKNLANKHQNVLELLQQQQKRCSDLQNQLKSSDQEKLRLISQLESTKYANEGLQKKIKQMQQENQKVNEMQEKIKHHEEKFVTQKNENKRLQEDLQSAWTIIDKLKEEKEKNVEKIKQLEDTLKETERTKEEIKNSLTRLQQETKGVEDKNTRIRYLEAKLKEDDSKKKSSETTILKQQLKLKESYEQSSILLDGERARILEKQDQISRLESKLKELQDEVDRLRKERSINTTLYNELQTVFMENLDKLQEEKKKNEQLQQQHEVDIQNLLDNYAKYVQQVRDEKEALRYHVQQNHLVPLDDFFEVPFESTSPAMPSFLSDAVKNKYWGSTNK